MLREVGSDEAGVMTTTTIENNQVSATLEGVKGNFYLRLWRSAPRELGFLLLAMPVAVVGFAASMTFLNAGIATLITFFIGVFFIAGMFYVSRWFGTLEIIRLRWAGRPAITRPEWPRQPGFWGWLRSLFGNGHYWLYSLHTALVNYVLSIGTWTVTVVWLSTGLGGVSYWFWRQFLPVGRDMWSLFRWGTHGFTDGSGHVFAADAARWATIESLVFLAIGILLLATLPFVTRALVLLHQVIARGMLSAFPSDGLRREVSNLSESRGAAISAEGHSLRRLERDIHDGPQQRLVRLQMDLAATERAIDSDPDAARVLIAQARALTQEALEELRALSRGFAPPILMDRGLVAALESLASRSTVPVTITNSVGSDVDLPQEIERNAYFVASELVANAAKHSGASVVDVTLAMRRIPEHDDWWLDVTVTDDGKGGASKVDGYGLAGLDERLRGLGGTFELLSPEGGPTVATGHFPVTY